MAAASATFRPSDKPPTGCVAASERDSECSPSDQKTKTLTVELECLFAFEILLCIRAFGIWNYRRPASYGLSGSATFYEF
jgi:hypothetical protein